jgi:hypothetical protein
MIAWVSALGALWLSVGLIMLTLARPAGSVVADILLAAFWPIHVMMHITRR